MKILLVEDDMEISAMLKSFLMMEVMGKIRESSTVSIIIISAKDTDSDKTMGHGL